MCTFINYESFTRVWVIKKREFFNFFADVTKWGREIERVAGKCSVEFTAVVHGEREVTHAKHDKSDRQLPACAVAAWKQGLCYYRREL